VAALRHLQEFLGYSRNSELGTDGTTATLKARPRPGAPP